MLVDITIILLLIVLISLIFFQIKNKKNIWQKISFLYNQIYTILVVNYYNENILDKDVLREEIIDYYNDIVKKNSIDNKYINWDKVKWFLLEYYTKDNKKLVLIYEMLDLYYNKYYRNTHKSIILLVYLIIIIVIAYLYYMFK